MNKTDLHDAAELATVRERLREALSSDLQFLVIVRDAERQARLRSALLPFVEAELSALGIEP